MELDDALTQISEIRQRMAVSQEFIGYRAASTAITAAIAIAAALLQATIIPIPVDHVQTYLIIWLGAAVSAMAIVGVEMAVRSRRSGSALRRETTLHAVDQFVPCLVIGALSTYVIVQHSKIPLRSLPGLWMLFFSLGVFASRRFLPRGAFAVAGYYALAGLYCLSLGPEQALAPWTMGGVFGAGQAIAAVILYWFLERNHARQA